MGSLLVLIEILRPTGRCIEACRMSEAVHCIATISAKYMQMRGKQILQLNYFVLAQLLISIISTAYQVLKSHS